MLERINLVPKETAAGNVWQVAYASLALLFVLSCFSVYLLRQDAVRKINDVETRMKTLSRYRASAANIQKNVHSLSESVRKKNEICNELSKEAEMLAGVGGRKFMYSVALRSIAMDLPASVRCNDISFDKGTGSIAGEALFYDELPGFVDRLKRHPIFENVSLIEIDRGLLPKSSGSYAFKVEFTMKPNRAPWSGEGNG